MHAIEQNLYRHTNGTFYALWTNNGRTERRSLKTKDINEARRTLKELFRPASKTAPPVLETTAVQKPPVGSGSKNTTDKEVPPQTVPAISSATTTNRPDYETALKEHLENTPFNSEDTKRNFKLRQKTLLQFCTDWEMRQAPRVPPKVPRKHDNNRFHTGSPCILILQVRGHPREKTPRSVELLVMYISRGFPPTAESVLLCVLPD